jgi:hypothetical protein
MANSRDEQQLKRKDHMDYAVTRGWDDADSSTRHAITDEIGVNYDTFRQWMAKGDRATGAAPKKGRTQVAASAHRSLKAAVADYVRVEAELERFAKEITEILRSR